MSKVRFLSPIAAVLVAWPFVASGHTLHYEVAPLEAVSIRVGGEHGVQPAHAAFTVYPPESDVPYQQGRSDADGRILFYPDRPGDWRITITLTDGHGLELTTSVDAGGWVGETRLEGRSHHGHWGRLLAGIGYLFGLAALWYGWRRWRAGR